MSYMNAMKATEDILTLVEAMEENYKNGMESSPKGGNVDSDPFGTVGLDEINDTVNPTDEPMKNDSLLGDSEINLSDVEKAGIRENLEKILADIQGDYISEPALEMIVNEVAKNSTFLTEADEDSVNSPMEKTELLTGKLKVVSDYINELLQVASDNGGELPPEEGEAPVGEPESTEGIEAPGAEGSEEEKPSEEKEEPSEEKEEKDPVTEAEVVEEAETTEEAPVVEGVCTECGEDAVVDVPESDVIKVVDDSEVEPIDDITPEGGEQAGEFATKADVDELKQLIKSLAGHTSAVLESAGLIKGTDPIKSVEGKDPSMGKPSHSSAQKTAAPKLNQPGFKLATLRDLTSKPTKAESNAPFGKENEAARNKALPSFKKDSRDHGKSNSEPDGGMNTATSNKKPNTGITTPTEQEKAAVLRESNSKTPVKSWLAEAAKLIRDGK